jgi:amino acid permease
MSATGYGSFERDDDDVDRGHPAASSSTANPNDALSPRRFHRSEMTQFDARREGNFQAPLFDHLEMVNESMAAKRPDGNTWRRFTFALGEQCFPNKSTTWTIRDSQETMEGDEMVVNIFCDLVPPAILPLSYCMVGTGYMTALILMCVFAGMATFTAWTIGRAMVLTGELEFAGIWTAVVGRSTAWVPDVVNVISCFANLLAMTIFFGELFAGAMPAIGLGWLTRGHVIAIWTIPLLPLSMLKDLSLFSTTSFAALIMVVYTLGVMVFRYLDGSYAPGGEFAAYGHYPTSDGNFWNAFAISPRTLMLVNGFGLGFMIHYNGCKYYREFVKHTPDLFAQYVAGSFALCIVIFFIAMTVGYATFGNHSDPVILNNYSADDSLVNYARIGMGLANVFSYPIQFSGFREAIMDFIAYMSPDWSNTCKLMWVQNTMTAVGVICIGITGILVTDTGLVLGLVGACCGMIVIYLVPCFLYDYTLKRYAMDDRYPNQVLFVRFLMCLTVVLICGALYMTVVMGEDPG